MKHELVKLKYEYNALEPYIDAKTMEIHYSKHHQTYVNNLNIALDKHPNLFEKSLDELLTNLSSVPEGIRTAVKNSAGGVYNHNFFWEIMSQNANKEHKGELKKAIDSTFSSFENFKKEFTNCALSRFGSGWTWLVLNKEGKLAIYSTANQDSPITEGNKPILTVDVWEHAYYLKYQNRRAEYLENWWDVVNWSRCGELYLKAPSN